jgi:hypothetical protein
MTAETDLKTLLATMAPVLHESPYVFCSVSEAVYRGLSFAPLGLYREAEGITIIATRRQASQAQLPCEITWACITLSVHSSLSAVGFLAAITGKLARAGIGVNPVSAYHHDHLFVPWMRREQVMDELRDLSQSMGEPSREAFANLSKPLPPLSIN